MKLRFSLKAAVIGIGAALTIALLASIGYFTGQLLSTSNKYQEMYFDTLYSVSEKLINADRDLYQAMLAAAQGYEIVQGNADIPEEYVQPYIESKKQDYHDNVKQTKERADSAAAIASSQTTLYRTTKGEDGRSFEENYNDFLASMAAWEKLFDVDTYSGEWGNFNNDFEAVRGYLSEMTDICEDWAKKEEAILKEDIQRRINVSIIVFGIIALVMLAIAIIVVENMRKSLKELDATAQKMASGNFSEPIVSKSKFSEFVNLSAQNETMRSRLRDAVSLVISGADAVGNEAEHTKDNIRDSQSVMNDISTAVENLAVGATAMANDVQNTSSITVDIGSAIDDVSSSVNETLNKVQQLSESSQQLREGLDVLRRADEETDAKAEQVAASVNETAEVVNKISTAADGIINIAGQTNLLALNASIEAARAGDAGRGFSVVAENIKGLATESDRLAGEITTMLKDISTYSERNKELTASIKDATAKETDSLAKMAEDFNQMLAILDQARSENQATAKQTVHMSDKKEGILDSIESLSSISEENAASTEETSASIDQLNQNMEAVVADAEKLNKIAEELKKSVSFFKI
ncbi:MAG: methyl-accepting chemotaxis protein [Lachnospiraceae bacterium]|nr:methyl-accepting chemotaxis protein [Lachnospiraceae bacterium]